MSPSEQSVNDSRFSLHLGVAIALSYVTAIFALVSTLVGGF